MNRCSSYYCRNNYSVLFSRYVITKEVSTILRSKLSNERSNIKLSWERENLGCHRESWLSTIFPCQEKTVTRRCSLLIGSPAHLSYIVNPSYVLRARDVEMSHNSGFTLLVSCSPKQMFCFEKTLLLCQASSRH